MSRIWCMAELVEAERLHIPQCIMTHSASTRTTFLSAIEGLDVRRAEATFEADRELVLSKIDDIAAFNLQLQELLTHRLEGYLMMTGQAPVIFLDEVILSSLG